MSRIGASGLPPRTLHAAETTGVGVRQGRPQARRSDLSNNALPLITNTTNNRRAKFYNGNQVGGRRPVSVFPCRDILLVFAATCFARIRKRTNFASQPALPVVLWKHPCKLSFRITKLLYEDSVSFVLEE